MISVQVTETFLYQVLMRRRIRLISFSGSQRRRASHHGHHHGAMEDQAGILSARLCPRNIIRRCNRYTCGWRGSCLFPHHENEIAQSEAANGTEFARYWMHNGFLKINNEKMSKSLGNYFSSQRDSREVPSSGHQILHAVSPLQNALS